MTHNAATHLRSARVKVVLVNKLLAGLLALSFQCGLCRAQAPALDLTFNPGSGVAGLDDAVNSIFVEPNGQIVLGGLFDHFNGVAFNQIARLNRDGSPDTSFFGFVSRICGLIPAPEAGLTCDKGLFP